MAYKQHFGKLLIFMGALLAISAGVVNADPGPSTTPGDEVTLPAEEADICTVIADEEITEEETPIEETPAEETTEEEGEVLP